ncbi:hypothetical protein CAPTEDRAFT_197437 [Capitella teleta]|uniref:NAD(P)-binding domain-containing protein n=1 Tax=Capitella teleta TaxID=283909 RepID=R7TVX9_CAPTE|nr:hypothetical protein CAPTEDRAFT_197437 [Capitella teleta]|eukprot:ELT97849.1 hypothetical protein CAPTEDRAFT_197437 [Capitella teleta]
MTDLVSLKKYRKCLILRSVTWDYRHINDVMHVAVIGATGATGRQVVQQSLTRKWSVTAIVRNQDSFKDIVDENLKVIVGDVYDTTSLRGAFQGCDAVLSCLGPRGLSNLLPWANVDIYSEPLRCTVQAMNNTHGLNRLVLLTGACTKASPQNPFLFEWVLKPIIRAPVADMGRGWRLHNSSPDDSIILGGRFSGSSCSLLVCVAASNSMIRQSCVDCSLATGGYKQLPLE